MKILSWFILLYPWILSAQGIFDFEEGSINDWGQAPADRWEISSEAPLKGNYSLHHGFDNPGAGEDHIFMNVNYPGSSDTLRFSFCVRHAYNPSRGNNWQCYFLSLLPDHLKDCMVFGVNLNTADDTLRLWQLIEGEATELINTGINYEDDIGRTAAPEFTISRMPEGSWSITMDISDGLSGKQVLGYGEELAFSSGKYLGFRYEYSSAQDRKIWLDDIAFEGSFEKDEQGPTLDTLIINGLNSIKLCFDEGIHLSDQSDFTWNNMGPDTLILDANEIQLVFPDDFPNRQTLFLSIHNIFDLEGNPLQDTMVSFYQNLAEYGEVVFNEIMSDPEPAVYLPPYEYLELFNHTESNIDLSGWTVHVNSKSYEIEHCEIIAEDFLLLSANNTHQHFEGQPILELFSSASVLNNTGAALQIYDQYSRLIHTVKYRELEKYDPVKSEGGWSLECADPDMACGGFENWKVSQHPQGGTPGRANSVMAERADLTPPEIKYAGLSDTNVIAIHFSESVFLSETSDQDYTISGIGPVKPVFYTSPLVNDVIDLECAKPLSNDTPYLVEIEEIQDCEGNQTAKLELALELPGMPSPRMMVLNEVMYDPVAGCQEYLELYNVSDQYLDLRDLKIAVRGDLSKIESLVPLSEDSHLIAPNKYIVVTPDEDRLREYWGLDFSIDVVEIPGWKSLPNDEGYLALFDRSELFLESLHYHDSLHHNLLMDPAGVALERISAESFPSRWMSAASSVSYGTPGTRNSQNSYKEEGDDKVELVNEVITPDLDGFNDYAELILRNFTEGSSASIYVTDINGYGVNNVVENAILSSEDHFFWDGHDAAQHLVLPGIYILHIKVYSEAGSKLFRRCCAVTYR